MGIFRATAHTPAVPSPQPVSNSGIFGLISSLFGGTPADAQIPVGQSGGTYGPKSISGDATLADTGALTVTKVNGQTLGALATLNVGTGLSSSGGNLNLTEPVPVAAGGTGATTAPGARTDLGVISWNPHGNANVTLTPADLPFAFIAAGLTAPRTWTLPLSAAVNPGDVLTIADNGGINGANTLTVQAQGTDVLLGPGISGNQATIIEQYGTATFVSSGTGIWLLYRIEPPQVLPTPTTSTLGGVKAVNAVSHKWVNAIDTTGTPQLSQPAFSDISGTVAASQLPAPTTSALGGIEAIIAVSHQWVASIDTSGVPHLSQPAFSDISGTCAVNQGGTGDTGTARTSFTPTITPTTSGAFGSVSGNIRYKTIGKTVFFNGSVTITTVGTAVGSVQVSLPITPNGNGCVSGATGSTNVALSCILIGGVADLFISNYDGSSPIVAGRTLFFGGVTESQ